MTDLRQTIKDAMAARGWTPYRLHQELRGQVPQATVYDYLSGRSDTRGEVIAAILDALNLGITAAPAATGSDA